MDTRNSLTDFSRDLLLRDGAMLRHLVCSYFRRLIFESRRD
jgi:hypothetical protein